MEACLSLLRKLPPQNVARNLDHLVALQPALEAELRNAVDLPCRVLLCPEASREFLACDYNREGALYRYLPCAAACMAHRLGRPGATSSSRRTIRRRPRRRPAWRARRRCPSASAGWRCSPTGRSTRTARSTTRAASPASTF